MKRERFTELKGDRGPSGATQVPGNEIIGLLKESEAGAKTDEICRRHGISSATFYSWRKTCVGIAPSLGIPCKSSAGRVDQRAAAQTSFR